MARTGERQINVELGNILRSLRRGASWSVFTEATRTLEDGAGLAPDLLITDPSGSPVVIEAEIAPGDETPINPAPAPPPPAIPINRVERRTAR